METDFSCSDIICDFVLFHELVLFSTILFIVKQPAKYFSLCSCSGDNQTRFCDRSASILFSRWKRHALRLRTSHKTLRRSLMDPQTQRVTHRVNQAFVPEFFDGFRLELHGLC